MHLLLGLANIQTHCSSLADLLLGRLDMGADMSPFSWSTTVNTEHFLHPRLRVSMI